MEILDCECMHDAALSGKIVLLTAFCAMTYCLCVYDETLKISDVSWLFQKNTNRRKTGRKLAQLGKVNDYSWNVNFVIDYFIRFWNFFDWLVQKVAVQVNNIRCILLSQRQCLIVESRFACYSLQNRLWVVWFWDWEKLWSGHGDIILEMLISAHLKNKIKLLFVLNQNLNHTNLNRNTWKLWKSSSDSSCARLIGEVGNSNKKLLPGEQNITTFKFCFWISDLNDCQVQFFFQNRADIVHLLKWLKSPPTNVRMVRTIEYEFRCCAKLFSLHACGWLNLTFSVLKQCGTTETKTELSI